MQQVTDIYIVFDKRELREKCEESSEKVKLIRED